MGLRYRIALCLVFACAQVEATTTTVPPNATTTESHATEPDIIIGNPSDLFNTAVFKCGDFIYGSDVNSIFPPSDSIVHMLGVNTTSAKAAFDKNIDLFCEKVDPYSRCVKHFNEVGCTPEEEYVRRYIDMDQFGSAFTSYCMNKELIKSQVICTFETVRNGDIPCEFGGVEGFIQGLVLAATQRVAKDVYCGAREATLRCRKAQLASCDVTYSDVMSTISTTLTAKYCRK
ncbi:uncharacterized protein LOC128224610 [Mya arenaria]|uniref:uncharacterized protein LOC128224610 n=1 Tax=Mya arenaria TaxID=6604 RepID=UPI0022E60389|nr:uncharacterized protein LOC128224610 [Mya arenaria]XP_052790493.1 uncharacterized protein LOC128224610 [Mya arenaria]